MPELTDRADNKPISAGLAVLQWLTYAFWGWLILGIIWLVWIILANAISGTAMDEIVPYALAASIVLLPLAFVTDLFYRKHEDVRKRGVASLLMVVHTVVFALSGIGTLVIAVFLGLNLLIGPSTSDTDVQITALLTLTAATLLYGLVFVRTLNPFKTMKFARLYGYGMLGLTVALLVLAFVGPTLSSIAARDDRRIADQLPSVSSAINAYVRENKQLPTNLAGLDYNSPDAQALVDDGLVEYKRDGRVPSEHSLRSWEFRYQLCVNYEKESGSDYDYGYPEEADEYSTYPNTYQHDSGEVCYKLYSQVYLAQPGNTLDDIKLDSESI